MSRNKGAHYEQLALRHHRTNGLRLVEKNFHCRLGEIDLIFRDDNCLVFVEVRYRTSNRFASAAQSVDEKKQAKIARTASMFLGQNPSMSDYPVRFDVVAFDSTESDQSTLQWTRDAFRL